MYKITINNKETFEVHKEKNNSFRINDREVSPDMVEVRNGMFHVIIDNRSFTAEVVSHNKDEKQFQIRVNHNLYSLKVHDRYDVLLKELGLDALQSKKVSDLKAPMPGLVVDVAVSEGQEVKQGDKLLVLEAMKMENILKSPADAVVKQIKVKKGNTVEKNEILILFS